MKDVNNIIECLKDKIPSIEESTMSALEQVTMDDSNLFLFFKFSKPFVDYADYCGNMPFIRLVVCIQLSSLIPEYINADNTLIYAGGLDGFGITICMPQGWLKQLL